MKQNQEYLHLTSHLQSSMSSFLKPVSFFAQGDTEADIYIFCVCVCVCVGGCWPLTDDHCQSL